MVMAVEDSVVRVVVRVRPPTPKELESQRRPVIQVVDERMLVFDPEECDGGFPGLKWSGSHNGPKKKGKDLTFVFDRVFGEMATQEDVFQHTTHNILDSFLQGYNCSVFAYGATGAGKTHTMLGREGEPGIMYLTTMELYRRLEARQEEKQFEVLISYLEVYNEQIHDLLEPKGPLTIREDPDKGVVVPGLSFHQPASAEQLLEMLTRGNCSRTQSLSSSSLQPGPSSQSSTLECHAKNETLQEESLGSDAQGQEIVEESASEQEQCPQDKQCPTQKPEPNLPGSPSPSVQAKPGTGQHSPQKQDADHSKQLALQVLRLAQRQYSLLQAANLLTPDMISEFETLQQLVLEKSVDHRAESPRSPALARGDPLAQALCSESKSSGYCGPVTRTMAKQLNGLTHTLGAPLAPDCTSDKTFQKPTKEKKRKLTPEEPGSLPAPNLEMKRQRQSFLPCLRRGSLPKAQPCSEPRTPKRERASSPSPSSRVCPATVIKSRVPLGPSALQNCSTPLALPTRDLNTTFNVSEESPSKPSFQEFVDWEKVSPELNSTDQPFLPSAPVFIFTKGRKPSLPAVTASKKRRTMRPSVSRGRSCIARLHSSTLKKPNRPFTVPEPPLSPHCLDDQRTPKGLTGVTESY